MCFLKTLVFLKERELMIIVTFNSLPSNTLPIEILMVWGTVRYDFVKASIRVEIAASATFSYILLL